MKSSFFAAASAPRTAPAQILPPAERLAAVVVSDIPSVSLPARPTLRSDDVLWPSESARIAIYDGAGAAPRVEEVAPVETGEYISLLATRTYELARALGGCVPFSVISEIVENYIHAGFRGPVVTILDSGNTIRFSDQGPGIKDKMRALEPGYTTASAPMKRYIRGVGSGLPLARECLSFADGTLSVQDNLGTGAVVTVSVAASHEPAGAPVQSERTGFNGSRVRLAEAPVLAPAAGPPESFALESPALPTSHKVARLSNRQKRVLALVMDAGSAGPSLVAKELAVGLSTAYRDLARLEELGLIASDESGKRTLTLAGSEYLTGLLNVGV